MSSSARKVGSSISPQWRHFFAPAMIVSEQKGQLAEEGSAGGPAGTIGSLMVGGDGNGIACVRVVVVLLPSEASLDCLQRSLKFLSGAAAGHIHVLHLSKRPLGRRLDAAGNLG